MRDTMLTANEHNPSLPRNAEVFLLDLKEFEHYWPDINESLDASPEIWNKWFTKDAIFDRIMKETIQVWMVCEKDGPIHAMFMTQVLIADIGRILQVFWMRGRLPDGAVKCISLALDGFGSHHGCVRLAVVGRKGWERMLRNFGAEVEAVALSRPIRTVARN